MKPAIWWLGCRLDNLKARVRLWKINKRKLLWDWVQYRNGSPNTDFIGFYALSDCAVKNLIEDSKKHPKWKEFFQKWEGK